jgi:hypothetical protein
MCEVIYRLVLVWSFPSRQVMIFESPRGSFSSAAATISLKPKKVFIKIKRAEVVNRHQASRIFEHSSVCVGWNLVGSGVEPVTGAELAVFG